MNILGIIPAREGSKGIQHKNIYPLCGKPLIEHTLDEAMNSSLESMIISTDSKYYADKYKNYNIRLRPDKLAQDDTPILPVVLDVLSCTHGVDAVMILQPTSPLRLSYDIDLALLHFEMSKASSLYSGYYMGLKTKNKVYDKHTIAPHFQRNGAIFIAKTELIKQGKLWDENVYEYEMPKSRSIDIDDMDDMFMAESILKNRKENEYESDIDRLR